jgi:hypothetical protein
VLGRHGEKTTLTGREVLDVVIHTRIWLFGYAFLYTKKAINFYSFGFGSFPYHP